MRRVLVSLLVLGACSGTPSPTDMVPSVTSRSTDTSEVRSPTRSSASEPTTSDASDASATSTTIDPNAVFPSGYELVTARVVEPDGTVCELCLWLADTAEQRRRGLMFVTDLGGADGMAFRYERPHVTRFWMKDTPLPLSIAFFDPDGAFIESFDMEPCLADSCPRYATPNDFLVAVETYQGGLESIGMVPGSTFELLDLPCPT